MKFKGIKNIIKDVSNSKKKSQFFKIIFWYVVSIIPFLLLLPLIYLAKNVLINLFTKGIIPTDFNYVIYVIESQLSLLIISALIFHSICLFILLIYSMDYLFFLESSLKKIYSSLKLSQTEKGNIEDHNLLESEEYKKDKKILKRFGPILLTVAFSIILFTIPVQIHFSDKEIDDFCDEMARHIISEHSDKLLKEKIDYSYARGECKRQISNFFSGIGDQGFSVYENLRVIKQEKLADIKELIELYTHVNLVGMDNAQFCEILTSIISEIRENDDYSLWECIEDLSHKNNTLSQRPAQTLSE